MSFCFLYNPSANRERSLKKFAKVKKLTSAWPDVKYITTENRQDLQQKANEAAKSFDVVVACGGDGTVKDVAVSLLGSDTKLGILPMGSGNDFTKSVGLNVPLADAVQILHRRRTKSVDMGTCNEHYFINTIGFGFDGQANYYASQSSIRNGLLRYAVAALKTIFYIASFKVEIETGERSSAVTKELIMLTVANGRVEGGNFNIALDASPCDGLLNLVTIEPISKMILPFLLPFLVIGNYRWISYINDYEIEKVTLFFQDSVYIHADGEQIYTDEKKFEVGILPNTLQVIC